MWWILLSFCSYFELALFFQFFSTVLLQMALYFPCKFSLWLYSKCPWVAKTSSSAKWSLYSVVWHSNFTYVWYVYCSVHIDTARRWRSSCIMSNIHWAYQKSKKNILIPLNNSNVPQEKGVNGKNCRIKKSPGICFLWERKNIN